MPAHTHYDNLKVARNAPPEVIRAAYKTLSQKFHPDRNPGNVDYARIMAILNASYDVLSDPEKRQRHDAWVVEEERSSERAHSPPANQQRTYQPSPPAPVPAPMSSFASVRTAGVGALSVLVHLLRHWFLYGIAASLIWVWATDKPSSPAPGPKPYLAQPAPPPTPAIPQYTRPAAAPNGSPWPSTAGYVRGYQRLHGSGLSTVTVDNSRNDSDVFVKLVSLDGAQAYPVRQFFIPSFGTFTLGKVSAGSYDVRYRDLNSGGLSRSDAFTIDQTTTEDGTEFSRFTMTLYKVKNGNMKTHGLAESEFE